MTDASLASRKAQARADALDRRLRCDPAWGRAMGEQILAKAPPGLSQLSTLAIIAGYWPLAGEIDIRPLLTTLCERGHIVVLPRTPPRGRPLTFHAWTTGAAMQAGPFGTQSPDGPEMRPDWLLVPLLAFDRGGRRLGYGAGYYDRTLAALPDATTIGCGFAALEMPQVPAGDHDVRLNAVATEREFIRCDPALR